MRSRSLLILTTIAVLLAAGACVACGGKNPSTARAAAPSNAPGGGRGIPVLAEAAKTQDVPVYLRGLGSVAAYNTVTVKSRVDGALMQVNFKEGDEVREGQLLAVIDPRPYQVQLHQAEANLAKDQAQMKDAQVNLARFESLWKEGVIAKQQLDTQAALVGQYEGAIGADRATIENAKLQLVYSRITAPISGRVGLRLIDVGNIVHANDPGGLLVITQLHPIAVMFTLPEDYIPAVLQAMRRGPLDVDAYTRDDRTKIATGKLLTLNNQIDPTTGTNRFKAVFQNQDRALWPNQFVNVRLLLQVKKNTLTVPNAAIQHGAQGTFAFVVKPDNTVEARPVKVGVTEGPLTEVDSGIANGEQVVTDGQDKLQPGAKVEVQKPNRPGGPPNGNKQPGS
ncbi:MAG: MdtA/MuxA family multidrug efflux RND transporter periplasmic adaptor subunit [Terriglobales bacterium]